MRPLIVLLLMLTTISNIKGDFSISTFLKYIQEKGLYEMFAEIKYYYGIDISIDVCKELTKSNDCETVIRIYIPSKTRQINPGEESTKNIVQIIDYYYQILINAGYKPFEIENLKKKMMKYA